MDEEAMKEIQQELRSAIEHQIANDNPPIVRKTRDRLQREGLDEDEVMRLMSTVLVTEMTLIIREDRPFDEDEYTRWMEGLPDLGFLDEGA